MSFHFDSPHCQCLPCRAERARKRRLPPKRERLDRLAAQMRASACGSGVRRRVEGGSQC